VPPQKPDPKPDSRKSSAVRLGKNLKRLRLAAGLTTIAALANRIDGYGEDMISKVENGHRVPRDELYCQWLDACEASEMDRECLDDMLADARGEFGPVPQFFELYVRREKQAAFLRLWALDVLPGLLQTYDYAYALFLEAGLDEDEAAVKANARVKRRANAEGPDAKQVTAIIYEPVLYCQVGTPEVMAAQLEDLLKLSRRPNVVLQVVRSDRYFIGREGQFEIASGPDIPDTLVMYNVEDQTQDDHALTGKAAASFERIRGHALTIDESRAVIREAVEHCNSQQQ
jgi:transcriptional regulator with XRE-family HTH domain